MHVCAWMLNVCLCMDAHTHVHACTWMHRRMFVHGCIMYVCAWMLNACLCMDASLLNARASAATPPYFVLQSNKWQMVDLFK